MVNVSAFGKSAFGAEVTQVPLGDDDAAKFLYNNPDASGVDSGITIPGLGTPQSSVPDSGLMAEPVTEPVTEPATIVLDEPLKAKILAGGLGAIGGMAIASWKSQPLALGLVIGTVLGLASYAVYKKI